MAADRVAVVVAAEGEVGLAADAQRRIIALLPESAELADGVAAKLKLPKPAAQTDGGRPRCGLGRPAAAPACLSDWSRGALDRALLAGYPATTMAALSDWTPPRLPIGGGDLIALGLEQGSEVARTLRTLEDQWVAEGFPDRARTRAIAAALVQGQ